MSEERALNVLQRLNEVKKVVEYAKKDAQVQGYKAVTHDQVTAISRDQFVKQGVIVVPTELSSVMIDTGTFTSKQTPWMRFEASYSVAFINIDEPADKIEVRLTSHALDTGDKAPGKSLSYAVKYAILKLLQIETGENDESRETDVRSVSESIEEAVEAHKETINAIAKGIESGHFDEAVEAWNELTNNEKQSLWHSPTACKKLGIEPPFTTKERTAMKSDEWMKAQRDISKEGDGEENE